MKQYTPEELGKIADVCDIVIMHTNTLRELKLSPACEVYDEGRYSEQYLWQGFIVIVNNYVSEGNLVFVDSHEIGSNRWIGWND